MPISDEDIERACQEAMDRQEVDKFCVEPSEFVWLTSAGIHLDDLTADFKANVVYREYLAHDCNISQTAKHMKLSFNTVKTHIRHYERLSKDC